MKDKEPEEMISVYNWFQGPRKTQEEISSLIYGMNSTCHKLATKNYYVPYLDIYNAPYLPSVLNQIYVDFYDPSKVAFIGATPLPREQLKEGMEKNIEFLAMFAISQYAGFDISNGLINKEFAQNFFPFLPEDVVAYYDEVLIKNKPSYLDEFLAKNAAKEEGGQGKGNTLVKALPGMGVDESNEFGDFNKAGFAQNVALTLMFLSVSMILMGIVLFLIKM